MRSPGFHLGVIVATPGALELAKASGVVLASLLQRHQSGDWGDIHEADIGLNEQALRAGARIFSVYNVPHNSSIATFWFITEADRESTTVLLPEDY